MPYQETLILEFDLKFTSTYSKCTYFTDLNKNKRQKRKKIRTKWKEELRSFTTKHVKEHTFNGACNL